MVKCLSRGAVGDLSSLGGCDSVKYLPTTFIGLLELSELVEIDAWAHWSCYHRGNLLCVCWCVTARDAYLRRTAFGAVRMLEMPQLSDSAMYRGGDVLCTSSGNK